MTKEIENEYFRRIYIIGFPYFVFRFAVAERVDDEVYTPAFVQYFGAKMKKKG
ncbi:MAG: hypothetical protein ACLTZT_12790 [Butyricimonas faecalis]